MSSEKQTLCLECKLPTSQCLCRFTGRLGGLGKPTIEVPSKSKSSSANQKTTQASNVPPSDGIVRIGRSTKGRRGKGVTIVTGIPLDGDALKELAQTLKGKCGAGGTVKDGVIEIQGEHREVLQKTLESLGYRVKQSGG